MADISTLQNSMTSVTALSNLVIVSSQKTVGYQPQAVPGNNGSTNTKLASPLLFHYEGLNQVTQECDVTDNYLENNTVVNDQVAIKPLTITVQGFIGELNDVVPQSVQFLKTAADKLVAVSAYVPQLTIPALIAYDTAFAAYQTAENVAQSIVQSAASVNNLIQNTGGTSTTEAVIDGNGITNPNVLNGSTNFINTSTQTKQQIVYQQFYGYQKAVRLFTVQTPWAIFENMVLESFNAIQDETTRMVTDFQLKFKQLRFASTATALIIDTTTKQNRLAAQSSQEVTGGNKITQNTDETPTSLAGDIQNNPIVNGIKA